MVRSTDDPTKTEAKRTPYTERIMTALMGLYARGRQRLVPTFSLSRSERNMRAFAKLAEEVLDRGVDPRDYMGWVLQEYPQPLVSILTSPKTVDLYLAGASTQASPNYIAGLLSLEDYVTSGLSPEDTIAIEGSSFHILSVFLFAARHGVITEELRRRAEEEWCLCRSSARRQLEEFLPQEVGQLCSGLTNGA